MDKTAGEINPVPVKPMPKLEMLVFLVDQKSEDQKSHIDDDCLDEVEAQLSGHSGDHLYLLMQTYGGDPFSAVRIMKILHDKYTKISAIIPSHSTSAGTLMALGCDEIFMLPKSILGPLDLPIEHPTDGSRISALDVKNTITTISSLSDSVAKQRFDSLRENCRIGKREAAKIAYETATQFVEPIVDKIDPYHLQKSYRELQIGFTYAFELLKSRMMKKNPYRAWITARKLVDDYPAHEFGISSEEAREKLKLVVKNLDTHKDWARIKSYFEVIDAVNYKFIGYTEI